MTIFDVLAKQHPLWAGSGFCQKPDVVLFYDEDRKAAIKFMRRYDKQHGFTMDTRKGNISIADLVLREREATGKEISRTSYIKLFDVTGGNGR